MSLYQTRPAFGAPRMSERYYEDCTKIIISLRETATLAVIADHLNAVGLTTPMGKTWQRNAVANFIRNHSI